MKNSIQCPGCREEYCCGYVNCTAKAKGNAVKEYCYPDGSRVIIMDSGYINRTPEELQETLRFGWQLNMTAAVQDMIKNSL